MLKKLRIKFILINMTIVTIMLALIFTTLYISTSRSMERESIQMMASIAMNPLRMDPPDVERDDIKLPYFSIMINNDGERIGTGGGYFDLSDEELVQKIVEKTSQAAADTGILDEYDLRYYRIETPMGQCYVFADITSEQAIKGNMIRTLVIVACGVFLVFLGISLLLARWAVKPVEEAWKQQKQFVADASHELKTPITVIMTDAELLNSWDCSETERIKLSDSIITISGQMRGLVESLLDLARMDSGSVKTATMELSLSDIAQEAAMLYEPVFFEKEMPFDYEVDADITINGNKAQMKQLISALLDNAAKYASPCGEIHMSLARTSPRRCLLAVANQGDEIPPEDLANLFKRFYRADKARSSRNSYGLGLSIAERIAEEHKGRIWAESQGGLNTFYVDLPCWKN